MEKRTQVTGTAGFRAGRPGGKLLARSFFAAAPDRVGPRLLGKLLAVRGRQGFLTGRIVEVEAYLGPHTVPPDPAAHSYRGPTPRNQVLFGPPGIAYVYAIYGRYFCMNITCEVDGLAGCLLLRALEPISGLGQMAANRGLPRTAPPRMLTSGPSRICQALGITRLRHNGLDVTSSRSPIQVRADGCSVPEALVTVRIGIRHGVDRPLRYTLPGHVCVSGARRIAGTRLTIS